MELTEVLMHIDHTLHRHAVPGRPDAVIHKHLAYDFSRFANMREHLINPLLPSTPLHLVTTSIHFGMHPLKPKVHEDDPFNRTSH